MINDKNALKGEMYMAVNDLVNEGRYGLKYVSLFARHEDASPDDRARPSHSSGRSGDLTSCYPFQAQRLPDFKSFFGDLEKLCHLLFI